MNAGPLIGILTALMLAGTNQFAFAPPAQWHDVTESRRATLPSEVAVARVWVSGKATVVWIVELRLMMAESGEVTPEGARRTFLEQAAKTNYPFADLTTASVDGCPGGVWVRYAQVHDAFEAVFASRDVKAKRVRYVSQVRYVRPLGSTEDRELISRMVKYCQAVMNHKVLT